MKGVAAFLAVSMACFGGSPCVAAPRIACPNPVLDFGTLPETETVEHGFVLENRGDKALRIGKIRGCCGAVITPSARLVAPGSNMLLNVRMSLAGRRGRLDKRIYAGSNDPGRPYLRLTIKGTITEGRDDGQTQKEATNMPPPAASVPDAVGTAEKAGSPDAPFRDADISPVPIDYFFEAGCPACERVRREILPALRERYEGLCELREWDVGALTNVLRLMAYQEHLEITEDEPVMMVVDDAAALNGFEAIRTGLFTAVDAAIEARLAEGWKPNEPVRVPDAEDGVEEAGKRVERFTLVAVLAAGLADGFNPCAVATLVFLMSLVTVSKVGGARMLLLGVPYCLASFVTYVAIGLGLLRVVHLYHGLPMLRWGVETALAGGLLLGAWLSFRDAWKYRRSGQASDVTLQLPRKVKLLAHSVMCRGVRGGHLVLGGAIAGSTVTALETVCTGQVYVPTLALVIGRLGNGSGVVGKAWGYLFAYNTMFVLPLVVVFVLTWAGLKSEKLMGWSRRHVVAGKVTVGVVMAGLAGVGVVV